MWQFPVFYSTKQIPPNKNNLIQSLRLKWHTVTAIYVHILCTLHYFVVFKVIL